jgi:hypothetical protein
VEAKVNDQAQALELLPGGCECIVVFRNELTLSVDDRLVIGRRHLDES